MSVFTFFQGAKTAEADIAFDAASSATGTTSPLTFSHTVGSGSDRILIVGVSIRTVTSTVTSVTYGGTALTLIGTQNESTSVARVEMWRLINPATGTANIVVTLSANSDVVGGGASFTGVNQTTPLGTFASAQGLSTSASVAVTSAPGQTVIDTVAARGTAVTLTVGSGQTQQWNTGTGTGGATIRGAGSTEPGASSVTMSWTLGVSVGWAIGAVPLQPTTPTKLAITSVNGGANPTAGTAFAVVVQSQDAASNRAPVTAATNVSLSLQTGTGILGGTLTGTIAAGTSEVTITGVTYTKAESGVVIRASRTSGDTLTAGDSAAFTVNPGAATRLAFTTQPGNGTAGTTLTTQPVVTVQDALNNTVTTATHSITLAIGTNPPGNGVLQVTTNPLAATAGVATFSGVRIDQAGTGYTLTASATGLTGATSATFNVVAGAATQLVITTQPGGATKNAAFTTQPIVAIRDAFSNLTTSTATVSMAIASGTGAAGATISGNTAVAVAGVATFSSLSISKSGAGYQLTASSTGLTSATSPAFTVSGAAQLAFTTQPSEATRGIAFTIQPVVAVQRDDGTTETTATTSVTVAITGGTGVSGATLSGNTTVAASTGLAIFNTLAIDKSGATGYQLTASATGLTSATSAAFTVSGAAQLAFTVQPQNTTGGSAIPGPPKVSLTRDDGSAETASLSVSAVIKSGTGTAGATIGGTSSVVAAGGIATFSSLSIDKAGTGYRLTAATGGVSADSGTFDVTVGPAVKLGFTTQPSASNVAGTALTTQPAVAVQDAGGNTVTSATHGITLAIGTNPPGNGVLQVTTNPLAATAGVATFSGVRIDQTGTGYTLTASAAGLTGATSATFNVVAGATNRLVFTTQPGNATAGSAIPGPPTVTVQDQLGNTVTNSGAAITLAIGSNPGGGTLSGTITKSAVNGVASFTDLKINKAGTGYTVTASAAGFTGATSNTFNVTPGSAAKLGFTTQPGNATAGSAIPGPPTVTVQDQLGNTVTNSGAAITLAIGSNPGGGTLSGTITKSAVNGVASFTDLKIDAAGNLYTLTAASLGLSGAISGGFKVTSGPPGLAKFAIAPIPSPQTVGAAFTITISAQDANNNTVTTFNGTVKLTTAAGAITPSTSGFFANGTRTEQVTVTQAGLQRTISVSDGGGHGGTSNPFHVFPGPAAQLAFVVPPGTGTAGLPLPGPPTVAVQDSRGNIVNDSAASITVVLGANPAQGSLFGTQTKSAANGVGRFDDLAINTPGSGYTLSASALGLSGATSPPFTVANPGSIPAELNANGTTLSIGKTVSFITGDDLDIQSQSRVTMHFRQPSTLVPQAVTPLTLELQSGQTDVTAQNISLRLTTAHGEVRVNGTAEFRLTAGARTTLEVDSGSVQYLAGGGTTTVPTGGLLVADASGILSTNLQLTQPLHDALGLFTFLALSNPTAAVVSLTLTALDQNGLPLGGTANPRTIFLGPGSLFSDVTTSLFGLDPAAPVIGSIRIAASSLGVRVTSLIGDPSLSQIASGGLTGQRLAEVVISEEVGEFLALVNPGEQSLSITVTRVDAQGSLAGKISTTLSPSRSQMHLVDDLLGPPPVGGRGTLRLTAPDRFTAFAASSTTENLEALPVEPLGSLGDTLFAPFIVDVPGASTTTLTLANESAVPVRATIRLNDATGNPISGAISSPAFDVLSPGAKSQHTLRDIFQLAGDQTAFGWLEVSAVPTVSGPAAKLTGAVSIGDPSGQQFRTSLPLAQAGRSEIAIPFLIEGGGFFSFLALLNPSADQIAIVTLEAVGPDGTIRAGQQLRLEPRTSRFGFVRDLLPALSLPFTGRLQLRSEGAGIIVGSGGGDDAFRVLTILPSQ